MEASTETISKKSETSWLAENSSNSRWCRDSNTGLLSGFLSQWKSSALQLSAMGVVFLGSLGTMDAGLEA